MQATSNAVENSSVNIVPFPKRERSAIIPAETLYTVGQYDVSPGAKWLYTILRSHTNAKGACRIYLETLAEESGQTVRSVRRQLAELRQVGLLESERNGRSRANDFSVNMVPLKPAIFGRLKEPEKGEKTGHFLSENRPDLTQKPAKNGRSFKQANEHSIEQAGLALFPQEKFQDFSFPELTKEAFILHRQKNSLTLFFEILESLEKRNNPQVLLKCLEKYILKGKNGDIYPVTILRNYLWEEMEQEIGFDTQETVLAKEQSKKEEIEQKRLEIEYEREIQQKTEVLEKQRKQQTIKLQSVINAVKIAIKEQNQDQVKSIIKTNFETLQDAKRWLCDSPEWKEYQELLLTAGFAPAKQGRGFWGTPAWNQTSRAVELCG
jgi:Helix-turn-helix domain